MTRFEQAQSVLDNSDGMVADDSVRVALQQAIDSARNLAPKLVDKTVTFYDK